MGTLTEDNVRISLDAYWIPKEKSPGVPLALWERVDWVCAEWNEGLHRINELEAENARLREHLERSHYYVPMLSSGSTMDAEQAREAAIKSVVLGQRFNNG